MGARTYREKGPPPLALRLLAPVLVVSTVGVFVSGVWLLLLGHRSDQLLLFHKVSFIVFGVVFAIHFLAYAPRVVRSLRADWGSVRRRAVPGDGASWTARRCLARCRSRARAFAAERDFGVAGRPPRLTP